MVLPNEIDNKVFSEVPSPKTAPVKENQMIENNYVLKKEKIKKYMKVPLKTKQELHQMVQQEGKKIKEAAKVLGIKYATAKTIVFHKRQKRKEKKQLGIKMCGYTKKNKDRASLFRIISITGIDKKHCMEYAW
ncbi:unnamed protein product (macronuclear) [Paramecium tetraurelia]|uniref:HTH psq-type domain-containing protein n=1 Tax=Paramecium tetraurelia TaxID=5888 RepID=A0E783_PARTE|nr:uncharacterized protein GSPATT00023878001 [Paramecium tetraurelia]CAK91150.1 unnamed protein product [Paramecium tetraurelia]|eukprot:XP_001458547.1 hypothetical protein (macronuclear) [Paramecium tetraurelia strain d4-2]